MENSLTTLRTWSHILLWISVLLPILGGVAAVARFYVERHEKHIVSEMSRKQIESSQGELRDLKEKTEPRSLDKNARNAFVQMLSADPGHRVLIASLVVDPESSSYGDEIAGALKDAKWDVSHVKTSLNDFKGISLSCVTAYQRPLPGYHTLTSALMASGANIQPLQVRPNSVGTTLPEGTLLLLVGRK